MDIFDGRSGQFETDMEFLYPELDYDVLAKAPDEWVLALYPDMDIIEEVGPNYKAVNSFKDELKTDTARRDNLIRIINDFPYIHNTWPFDEFSSNQFDDALDRLKKFLQFRPYSLATDDNWDELDIGAEKLKPFPMFKTGLLALQHRHLILYPNEYGVVFGSSDYAVLTIFLRTYWGQLHPDDSF